MLSFAGLVILLANELSEHRYQHAAAAVYVRSAAANSFSSRAESLVQLSPFFSESYDDYSTYKRAHHIEATNKTDSVVASLLCA